jgi:hypothetical protein
LLLPKKVEKAEETPTVEPETQPGFLPKGLVKPGEK